MFLSNFEPEVVFLQYLLFEQVAPIREKTLSIANLAASRYIKGENVLLDLRHSKTLLLKPSIASILAELRVCVKTARNLTLSS